MTEKKLTQREQLRELPLDVRLRNAIACMENTGWHKAEFNTSARNAWEAVCDALDELRIRK